MDISLDNDRFGLPLSLVEALEADPSTDAALLANYLTGAAAAGRSAAGGGAARPAPVAAWIGAADGMSAEVFNLDQLLTDPLIQLVMASDHIVEDDIRAAMHHVHPPRLSSDRSTGRLAA